MNHYNSKSIYFWHHWTSKINPNLRIGPFCSNVRGIDQTELSCKIKQGLQMRKHYQSLRWAPLLWLKTSTYDEHHSSGSRPVLTMSITPLAQDQYLRWAPLLWVKTSTYDEHHSSGSRPVLTISTTPLAQDQYLRSAPLLWLKTSKIFSFYLDIYKNKINSRI